MDQLRHAILRSGERELALDLLRPGARRHRVRHRMLRFVRRGREFARRVCRGAMSEWTTRFIHSQTTFGNEIRQQQRSRSIRTNVLAA